MNYLNYVISRANKKISEAEDSVTAALRRILTKGGLPEDVVNKYCAVQASGGEWLLDNDERELAQFGIQVGNDDIVKTIKSIEENGLNNLYLYG
jgi:hypothetical protein